MSNDNNDTIQELLTRHLTGEASQAESARLEQWRQAHPDNEQAFQKLKGVLERADRHLYDRANRLSSIDVDLEWKSFESRVAASRDNVRVLNTSGSQQNWLRIAAAVLLLITAGWALNYFVSNRTIMVQAGEVAQTVQLPDGSSVTLNRQASLAYKNSFGENHRELELSGEAFFDVARNEALPFRISVGQAVVQVLGTSFNVREDKVSETVEVVVATGKVSLAGSTGKEVKLIAGERGLFDRRSDQLQQSANADVNFLSWKTRKLEFVDSDLTSVVATLNRTYGVNITIAAPVSPSCIVTVAFDGQSLDSVLKVLEETLQLTIRRNGATIEITGAGC